jgi:hypothetical protein
MNASDLTSPVMADRPALRLLERPLRPSRSTRPAAALSWRHRLARWAGLIRR